jgi:hypothetical protein
MSILDPAVRDLLVAIHEALNGAELRDYPVCAAQTAIRSAVMFGDFGWSASNWLVDQTGNPADAKRVRRADQWDLYQASEEGAA